MWSYGTQNIVSFINGLFCISFSLSLFLSLLLFYGLGFSQSKVKSFIWTDVIRIWQGRRYTMVFVSIRRSTYVIYKRTPDKICCVIQFEMLKTKKRSKNVLNSNITDRVISLWLWVSTGNREAHTLFWAIRYKLIIL